MVTSVQIDYDAVVVAGGDVQCSEMFISLVRTLAATMLIQGFGFVIVRLLVERLQWAVNFGTCRDLYDI